MLRPLNAGIFREWTPGDRSAAVQVHRTASHERSPPPRLRSGPSDRSLLGNRSLTESIVHGDWRPVAALWIGVLFTGFIWEMWNFLSYPKWIYHVAWGGCCKIFEMPLLGYGGYLPFALELYAMYHLIAGMLGNKSTEYVQVTNERKGSQRG